MVQYYFKSLIQFYSLAFNKQHSRAGNLFHSPFKRVEVDNESYFTQAIIYIHANSLRHKLVKDFTNYQSSSYQSYISNKPTLLHKQEVIEWFGGVEQFITIHKTQSEYYYANDVGIEEE